MISMQSITIAFHGLYKSKIKSKSEIPFIVPHSDTTVSPFVARRLAGNSINATAVSKIA